MAGSFLKALSSSNFIKHFTMNFSKNFRIILFKKFEWIALEVHSLISVHPRIPSEIHLEIYPKISRILFRKFYNDSLKILTEIRIFLGPNRKFLSRILFRHTFRTLLRVPAEIFRRIIFENVLWEISLRIPSDI